MRKAFTILEVIVVLAIMPVVLLALSGITGTFMRDLPQGRTVLSEQTTVLDLLDAMGRDVKGAVALPDSLGARQSDATTLLIALPSGTVAYERTDKQVRRLVLDRNGRDDPNMQRQWRVPDAVIDWQCWKETEAARAVEVHSYIDQVVAGHPQKKLAQTRVYLLNAMGKVREAP